MDWFLDFLYITPIQFSLIYEQYALIKYKPTINKYFNVIPRIVPEWLEYLYEAINKINEFKSLFPVYSFGYNRFNVFLKVFLVAKELIKILILKTIVL